MKFLMATAIAFPLFAQAQISAPTAEPVGSLAHVSVAVRSKFFGSFTQERDVPLGQSVTFSNLGAHHQAVVNHGSCTITSDPRNPVRDIDDGVVVSIATAPRLWEGKISYEYTIDANKFIEYREFDRGACGKVLFSRSASNSTSGTIIQPLGEALMVSNMRQNLPGDMRDLDVTVTVSDPHSR